MTRKLSAPKPLASWTRNPLEELEGRMEDSEAVRRTGRRRWIIIGSIVLAGFALGIGLLALQDLGAARDCAWTATATAYIDINANGHLDEGDLPLQGVRFRMDDLRNKYQGLGFGAYPSNWKGEVDEYLFLPGCPSPEYEVYPEIPAGYRLTTAARLRQKGYTEHLRFNFGFAYLPGAPTATPRPAAPVCRPYSSKISCGQ